jgi:broad specificity phosphatase PhoE
MRFLSRSAAAVAAFLMSVGAAASQSGWEALRSGGAVVLLRHARAPGVGDPSGFRLEDCATQRNLSPEGREQARRIGAAFRDRAIPVERVLSSRWCRALDTARLAFGSVDPYPGLDSFFAERGEREGRTREVRNLVSRWQSSGVLVLVTHQVNITALTGQAPAEGEFLVLKPDPSSGFTVVGRERP